MKFENLQELFLHEIKDLYDAEHQIVKALPKMKKAATSPDLQDAFQEHLGQTEEHIKRLEKVFESIDQKPKRETCPAMKGLIAEGSETIEENKKSYALDAALIASAQRVEHYEIAGYGTVRTYAQLLGYDIAVDLLQATLDEEGDTNKKLTALAEEINTEAV